MRICVDVKQTSNGIGYISGIHLTVSCVLAVKTVPTRRNESKNPQTKHLTDTMCIYVSYNLRYIRHPLLILSG